MIWKLYIEFTMKNMQIKMLGGRVLEERMRRLSPNMLDCLMCLKDWDRAQYRSQNRPDYIVEDFANLDVTED